MFTCNGSFFFFLMQLTGKEWRQILEVGPFKTLYFCQLEEFVNFLEQIDCYYAIMACHVSHLMIPYIHADNQTKIDINLLIKKKKKILTLTGGRPDFNI